MTNVSSKAIVDDTTIYTEFKGALAEQFVCQELVASGEKIFYWSADDSRQEIDFLIENNDGIIPIEVKSGKNLTSISFNKFIKINQSKYGYKVSNRPFVNNRKIINLPLYLTFTISKSASQKVPLSRKLDD